MSDHVRVPSRMEQGNSEVPAVSLSPADLHTPAPQKTTDSLIKSTVFADDVVRSAEAPGELPESIGRFTSLQLLGHGGFGFVYRAYDPELKRLVALKAPKMGVVAEPFLEEARAAAQLKHENIVTVYDVGRSADDQIFIAMEFVDGPTLSVQMRQQPFSHVEAAHLIARVARAVAFAHEAGIVHRDLKPGNILIAKDGTPKVGDFGLACYENVEPLKAGEVAGTPAYMAPEQVSGTTRQIDRRTDIWALGVILYQLLSGQTPFEGSREELFEQITKRQPKPLRSIDATIPPELEAICDRCLSKSPADRLPSALDLAQQLERFCASYDETRVVPPRPLLQHDDEPPQRRTSRPVLWAALVGAVVLVGWLGQSLWSGPGATGVDSSPSDMGIVVAEQKPRPPQSAAEKLLEQDHSAILEPRDPRWTPQRVKPSPVVWQRHDDEDSWAYDEPTGRFAVYSIGSGLFSFGKATAETTSLRTTFKHDEWDGQIGVFWGLRNRVDGIRECQLIILGRSTESGPFEIQVVEIEISDPHHLGPLISLNRVWFRKQTSAPQSKETTLQIDLRESAIDQILVNNEVAIRADELSHLPVPKPAASGRDVGIAVDGTEALIKSFLIRE